MNLPVKRILNFCEFVKLPRVPCVDPQLLAIYHNYTEFRCSELRHFVLLSDGGVSCLYLCSYLVVFLVSKTEIVEDYVLHQLKIIRPMATVSWDFFGINELCRYECRKIFTCGLGSGKCLAMYSYLKLWDPRLRFRHVQVCNEAEETPTPTPRRVNFLA